MTFFGGRLRKRRGSVRGHTNEFLFNKTIDSNANWKSDNFWGVEEKESSWLKTFVAVFFLQIANSWIQFSVEIFMSRKFNDLPRNSKVILMEGNRLFMYLNNSSSWCWRPSHSTITSSTSTISLCTEERIGVIWINEFRIFPLILLIIVSQGAILWGHQPS